MRNTLSTLVSNTPLPIDGRGWGWVLLLMTGALHLHAQTVDVEYTTELQTNFRESNFVNLLRLNAEQNLTNLVSLIAAYSHAFSKTECSDFIGIGGTYTTQNCELGIFSDMARFEETTEFATEITGKYQFTPYIYAQPSVHAIFTGHSFRSVVSLRFGIRL